MGFTKHEPDGVHLSVDESRQRRAMRSRVWSSHFFLAAAVLPLASLTVPAWAEPAAPIEAQPDATDQTVPKAAPADTAPPLEDEQASPVVSKFKGNPNALTAPNNIVVGPVGKDQKQVSPYGALGRMIWGDDGPGGKKISLLGWTEVSAVASSNGSKSILPAGFLNSDTGFSLNQTALILCSGDGCLSSP